MTAGGEFHSGACLCGAVRYRVAGPLEPVVGCHCTMCRKQTGHFLASTSVETRDLAIEGADSLRWYASSEAARRGFCGVCGSVLFWQSDKRARTAIAMGSFDGPTGVTWDKHIYVADKGDYYEIDGDAPSFDRRCSDAAGA
jgi:hypothetical protein